MAIFLLYLLIGPLWMIIHLSMVPLSVSRPLAPIPMRYGIGNPSPPRARVLDEVASLKAKQLVEPRGKAATGGTNRPYSQHVRLSIVVQMHCDHPCSNSAQR